MQINNVEIQVLIDDKPVKQFGHEGKTFVLAQKGKQYSVKIRNSNPFRILATVGIDGVDVMSGEKASTDGGGYIIGAYSSYEVKGYRQNLDTIGSFKFVRRDRSYAKSKGDAKDVGVIAVAVFREKNSVDEKFKKQMEEWIKAHPKWKEYIPYPVYPSYPTYPWYHQWGWNDPPYSVTCETIGGAVVGSVTTGSWVMEGGSLTCNANVPTSFTMSNCGMGSASATSNNFVQTSSVSEGVKVFEAGTSWGQKVEDKVVESMFERDGTVPFALFNIFYDFREGLEKLGVKITPEREVSFPRGFPGSFATPPSGWAG